MQGLISVIAEVVSGMEWNIVSVFHISIKSSRSCVKSNLRKQVHAKMDELKEINEEAQKWLMLIDTPIFTGQELFLENV